jgi:hypothetical protein
VMEQRRCGDSGAPWSENGTSNWLHTYATATVCLLNNLHRIVTGGSIILRASSNNSI